MTRRKVAPWLFAASVFLTGATILGGALSPAQAITSVEELRDVDSSSWAYQALSDLVEKYDVIEGYPNYTFKGNKAPSRYELAAALNAVIKAVGKDLARIGAEKANKSDLATLAKLQEEFASELSALNVRTTALEKRATAIESKNAEQDNRLDLLERTQLHGDFTFGTAVNSGTGVQDASQVYGRLRLGVKVPVVMDKKDSKVGEGDVIARLVAGFGSVVNDGSLAGNNWIAGDTSSRNEGGAVSGGLNTRQNLYVESAYFKQHFKPGIPVLTGLQGLFADDENHRTTADLYLGVYPWRNIFNRSPYRGDEVSQFLNPALVNNAGLLANSVNPGLALTWHQGLGKHNSLDINIGAQTLTSSDVYNGFKVSEELGWNYETAWFNSSAKRKAGTLYVGGNHIFFGGFNTINSIVGSGSTMVDRIGTAVPINDNRDQLNSVYAGWNQEWWRGIGTSVDFVSNQGGIGNSVLTAGRNNYGTNSTQVAGIQNALSAVLSVPYTAFAPNATKRAKDAFGIGYAMINPIETAAEFASVATRNAFASEHIGEVFYRYHVNDSVSIIPSVQAIFNRAGLDTNDANYVFGVRTNYVF
jgi:hypothetical protein